MLSILEDPWWVTAIGFIPIIGDAFDLARVPRQIQRAIRAADRLEERIKRFLRIQGMKARDLILPRNRTSDSYADELAELTYSVSEWDVKSAPRQKAKGKR